MVYNGSRSKMRQNTMVLKYDQLTLQLRPPDFSSMWPADFDKGLTCFLSISPLLNFLKASSNKNPYLVILFVRPLTAF